MGFGEAKMLFDTIDPSAKLRLFSIGSVHQDTNGFLDLPHATRDRFQLVGNRVSTGMQIVVYDMHPHVHARDRGIERVHPARQWRYLFTHDPSQLCKLLVGEHTEKIAVSMNDIKREVCGISSVEG